MQINKNELLEMAAILATSLEIMTAIAERASDENELHSIWAKGTHETEIVARAWELADEDTEELVWGRVVFRRSEQDSSAMLVIVAAVVAILVVTGYLPF